MKYLVVMLSCFALAGCNEGQKFREVHASCEQQYAIADLGRCLEVGLDTNMPNWRNDRHAGYVNAYIAWLNAAGDRVKSGEVSENDMRYAAATLLQRMRTEASQADQANTSARMAMFLTGLAVMNSGGYGYQPAAPQTTTLWSPGNRPITCTESLNVINCH
jgi:transposase-like protein